VHFKHHNSSLGGFDVCTDWKNLLLTDFTSNVKNGTVLEKNIKLLIHSKLQLNKLINIIKTYDFKQHNSLKNFFFISKRNIFTIYT